MNKKYLIVGAIIFLLLLVIQWNMPMTNSQLVGTYVSTNNEASSLADIPQQADTLFLKADQTFTSGFYGGGYYSTDLGFLSTDLKLHYYYEFGKASFSTHFSNKFYENTRIILNSDQNHYYEKID